MSWRDQDGPRFEQLFLMVGQLLERSDQGQHTMARIERRLEVGDERMDQHHMRLERLERRHLKERPRRTSLTSIFTFAKDVLECVQSLKTWAVYVAIFVAVLAGLIAPKEAKQMFLSWALKEAGAQQPAPQPEAFPSGRSGSPG